MSFQMQIYTVIILNRFIFMNQNGRLFIYDDSLLFLLGFNILLPSPSVICSQSDTRSSRISTLLSDTSDGNKSRCVGEIVVAPDSNGNFRNNLARDNKLHIAHLCICSA